MFLSIFTEMHVPVVIREHVWVQRDAGGLGDVGSVLGGCSGEGRSPTAAFLFHGIFPTISSVIGKKKETDLAGGNLSIAFKVTSGSRRW